jgi:hypothetical protein
MKINNKLLFFSLLLLGAMHTSFCIGSEQNTDNGVTGRQVPGSVQAEKKPLPPSSQPGSEKKQLTPFVPSEEIPGGQAVDFPADI